MWYQFAAGFPNPDDIFDQHPDVLTDFLEDQWANGSMTWVAALTPGMKPPSTFANVAPLTVGWHHLIYAYLVENTRAYEIFRRVVYEFAHGERLETPEPDAHNWLRATETLFYSDAPGNAIHSVQSDLRKDARAVRRNAYYRMLGMDLNHGADDNEPVTFVKPQAANREFVTLFEELLRQLWTGYSNATNTSGANPTDDNGISRVCVQIGDLLRLRRRNWMLSREEFYAVAAMRWFHYTLSFDSHIVTALKAGAGQPSDRLSRVADRVGLPMHSKARDYFDLAEPCSRLLLAIEQGIYDAIGAVPVLYTPGGAANQDVLTIIDRWSSATGRELRATPVATSGNGAVVATNGKHGDRSSRGSLVRTS